METGLGVAMVANCMTHFYKLYQIIKKNKYYVARNGSAYLTLAEDLVTQL